MKKPNGMPSKDLPQEDGFYWIKYAHRFKWWDEDDWKKFGWSLCSYTYDEVNREARWVFFENPDMLNYNHYTEDGQSVILGIKKVERPND